MLRLETLLPANSLQSLIGSRRTSLGHTPAGSAWALKALHPAADSVPLRGIPDADSFPSVCMDYETVIQIQAPVGSVGVWACQLYVLPHVVQPLSWFSYDTSSVHFQYGGAINPTMPQLGAYEDSTFTCTSLCSAYRMLYCGATADLDAGALNNQGSVVAGQFPVTKQRFNYSVLAPTAPFGIPYEHVDCYNYTSNFPGMQVSQLPGAYMGLAQQGCYMPVKLDPHSPWVTTAECNCVTLATPTAATTPNPASCRFFNLPTTSNAGGTFPFFSGNMAYPCAGAYVANVNGFMSGSSTIGFQQKNIGLMVFYNLNINASLTVKVKWGVEMRVSPLSVLAPAMQPSAMTDSLAMEAYSDLAATLPWAYPSSYNSWEMILKVIKGAWNVLRPAAAAALGTLPGYAARGASVALRALPSFDRVSGTAVPFNQASRMRGVDFKNPNPQPQRRQRSKSQGPPLRRPTGPGPGRKLGSMAKGNLFD